MNHGLYTIIILLQRMVHTLNICDMYLKLSEIDIYRRSLYVLYFKMKSVLKPDESFMVPLLTQRTLDKLKKEDAVKKKLKAF